MPQSREYPTGGNRRTIGSKIDHISGFSLREFRVNPDCRRLAVEHDQRDDVRTVARLDDRNGTGTDS
jgi:hypothetical protein